MNFLKGKNYQKFKFIDKYYTIIFWNKQLCHFGTMFHVYIGILNNDCYIFSSSSHQ